MPPSARSGAISRRWNHDECCTTRGTRNVAHQPSHSEECLHRNAGERNYCRADVRCPRNPSAPLMPMSKYGGDRKSGNSMSPVVRSPLPLPLRRGRCHRPQSPADLSTETPHQIRRNGPRTTDVSLHLKLAESSMSPHSMEISPPCSCSRLIVTCSAGLLPFSVFRGTE
jgi:hypothetical protein